jgi:hypothetical protein
MPRKMARLTPQPPFGLPEVLAAVRNSSLASKQSTKLLSFTPVRDSSGECRLDSLAEPVAKMTMSIPRLLLFLPTRNALPPYIQWQLKQQIRCLELYFHVAVISGSCDFDRECCVSEPDLVIFESGVYAGEREYANIQAHPQLCRLGFLNADAYCATRTVFMSDMDRWGVREYFTSSVSMAEYFPSIADRMFVWANCIDRSLYSGDSLEKNIPVLFAGSEASHYPWRIRVHDVIGRNFPTLAVPRFNWWTQSAHMPQGEDYARLLGAAWFVPACGTICKEVVRKHFEIPAAGACLVAERSAALVEAGFVDMVNCVFADTHDVVDKLNYLLSRKDELIGIIEAGQSLVLARHTMESRSQIFQWHQLRKTGPLDGRIVQNGPFGDLRLVREESNAHGRHILSGGVDRGLLHQAEAALRKGLLAEAEALFRRCLNYHFMPEAVLGLARCALKRGLPREAEQWLGQSLDLVLKRYEAPTPDPIEWAYLARAALCRGELPLADQIARAFPQLRHPELDRMRVVVGTPPEFLTAVETCRPSVHLLPSLSVDAWLADLISDLRQCGQPDIAQVIEDRLTAASLEGLQDHTSRPGQIDRRFRLLPISTAQPRRRGRVAARVMKHRLRSFARAIKRRHEPGPLLEELGKLASRADVRTVLVCGADPNGQLLSALAGGSSRNCTGPLTLMLCPAGAPPPPYDPLQHAAQKTGGTLTERALSMVVVAEHCDLGSEWFATHEPEFVVIEATDQPVGSRLFRGLYDQGIYDLLTSGRDRSGFAVLRRRPPDNTG